MLGNFDQGIHPEAQHTGFYNDPDMMVLGMPRLNVAQNWLHMALWAISGAPLLVGADLTSLSAESLAVLTNADAIRIDQDELCLQAIKVQELGQGLEVWSKFLSERGERAVLLLNRTNFPAPMRVKWTDLGLIDDMVTVREVWTTKDRGGLREGYSTTVPAHDGVLLIVKGTQGSFRHYEPAAKQPQELLDNRDIETLFTGVAAPEGDWAQIRLLYKNTSPAAQLADLWVNDQVATRVVFPPTCTSEGSVWIEAYLDRPRENNALSFATGIADRIDIDQIDVH